VFDAMREHLSDQEILEFTYVTATYIMHATMSRALRLEYDDVDDPVVEIDTPGMGKTGLDVMSMVDDA
ncbi:MAG: carboxymuconolactone decarboxylase family protein, partial [Acidimicrobiales bacterium]|nr:carboxymuconolactone decarboxylase family protein [Acidimicrobiales bacterium]